MRGFIALALVGCGTAPYDLPPETACEHAVASSPPAVAGVWTGRGVQSDGLGWDMVLSVDHLAPGVCARVDYPDIGCAGYWTCTHVSQTTLRAREHVTKGNDHCIDNDVEIAVDESGAMSLRASAGEIDAEARLERADD